MMIVVFLGFPQSGVTAYQVAKLNNKEAICTLLNNYYNTKSESEITEVSLCIHVVVCQTWHGVLVWYLWLKPACVLLYISNIY